MVEEGKRAAVILACCLMVLPNAHPCFQHHSYRSRALQDEMETTPVAYSVKRRLVWRWERSTLPVYLMASHSVLTFKFPRAPPLFLVLSLCDLTADSSSLFPLTSLFLISERICMQTLKLLQSTTAREISNLNIQKQKNTSAQSIK